jgi:Cu/Ag efflux protein CusF
MRLNPASLFLVCLLVAVSGCSSVEPRGEPLLTKAAVVSVQATIVRVDQQTREVTLSLPGKAGDTLVDLTVSDEVTNLDQVRPGDQVAVEYLEAVFVDRFRAGEVEPGVSVTVAVANAPAGARPAATAGIEKSVTAVIEGIDNENELVALRMPEGTYKIVKVSNPANLDRVAPGDKVRISFTRAWAISVSPSPES